MNNIVTFIGHAGDDPILKSIADSDSKVAKFSLAVKVFSKAEDQEPLWIDVDAWEGLGERVMKIVRKGREVMITGRLAINKMPAKGKYPETHKPVVKLTGFHVCGAKPKEEGAATAAFESSPRALQTV